MEWGCMQALIDFDGWRKWKDFSNSNTNTAFPEKDKGKLQAAKTNKVIMQSAGSKEPIPSRMTVANGVSSGTTKGKRNLSMHHVPEGIKEELRERSASDETDNNTDSNTEDGSGSGTVLAVGA